MAIDVRTVRDDELVDYIDALSTGFLERPDVGKIADEVRPHWDLGRTWAAVEDGRICGTFRSWATELTVPGLARLPAAAVAAVTVMPTHRRRGILRSLVAAEHGAMRERGEALGLLHASEYPIYGRFGYGPGTHEATWTLDARGTAFHGAAMGTIELVKTDEAALSAIKGVFETWRRRQPSEIRRRDHTWAYDLGRESAWGETWKGFLALHRDAGGSVDGYARYGVKEQWDDRQPRNVVRLDELHGLSDAASAALWRFLAGIDLVATVKAARRTTSDRLPWLLTNARAAQVSEVGDSLWVRLLDIPRALEARTYEREATLVLEIVDGEAAGGRCRLALDAGPNGARARPTDRSPDLTVDVAALGAAYLGGVPLRDAALGGSGADEHREGALADATALFRTLDEPWCSTFF